MATASKSCLSYLSMIFLLLLSSSSSNTQPTAKGVTLKLLHRFSPSLPFHTTDNFQKFLERNEKQYTSQPSQQGDVQLITPTTEHLFFVNLSIGQPPVPQYLAMDTGSRYVWVIGNCSNITREFNYSPYNSASYHDVDCIICDPPYLPYASCDSNQKCTFQTGYGDGHAVRGYLGYDGFVFPNNTIVESVLMGTAYQGEGSLLNENGFYGIFGLCPKTPSFVEVLYDLGGNKFSYYTGKVTDDSHPYSGLTLGENADLRGDTTPLDIIDMAHYRVFLKSISLDGEALPIDPISFLQGDNSSSVIIDTGSIKTWLADAAYDVLAKNVSQLLEVKGFVPVVRSKNLCYYGTLEEVQNIGFPTLAFDFAEGASLLLDEDDLFIESGVKVICMTVIKSSNAGLTLANYTIIGLTATQDYIMGYDLDNLRLSMKLNDL